jgi:hypothetical protein
VAIARSRGARGGQGDLLCRRRAWGMVLSRK